MHEKKLYLSPLTAGALALTIGLGFTAQPEAGAGAAGDCPHHAAHGDAANHDSLIAIPEPLRIDHEMLHEELAAATNAGGDTGEAAKLVRERLHGHFEEENAVALPPLGLLAPIADGRLDPEMAPAIEMAHTVEANYDRYLREHARIVEALERLESAAKRESKPEQVAFARRLRLHAQIEEQVLYPATILVGRYLDEHLGENERSENDNKPAECEYHDHAH
jgi:hypothetical protein